MSSWVGSAKKAKDILRRQLQAYAAQCLIEQRTPDADEFLKRKGYSATWRPYVVRQLQSNHKGDKP